MAGKWNIKWPKARRISRLDAPDPRRQRRLAPGEKSNVERLADFLGDLNAQWAWTREPKKLTPDPNARPISGGPRRLTPDPNARPISVGKKKKKKKKKRAAGLDVRSLQGVGGYRQTVPGRPVHRPEGARPPTGSSADLEELLSRVRAQRRNMLNNARKSQGLFRRTKKRKR
tara:strand:+ start:119 stop:634 length:516 start_codon:yes stop_codon:yes gene_type:complete